MTLRSPSTGRLTIAVLLDHLNYFGRGYEGQLRDALCKRCLARKHHLLFLYGGALDPPMAFAAIENTIFKVLNPRELDGVIVAAPLLSAHCGAEGVVRLVEGYKPATLCSIGSHVPGVPSLVLDNRGGMAIATEHIVRDHGRKNPVFLAGTPCNPEGEARLAGYRDVLLRYGIPFDPARVVHGHFLPALGRAAMDEIVNRGLPFDAVVAANDSMAIGAVQALRKRGIRVPQDVSVAGFDDLTLARLVNPPLTTIAQPFDTFADLAVGAIEDQVAGKPVPEVTEIPSRFIQRQSCGCGYHCHPETTDTVQVEVPSAISSERVEALKPVLADILKTASDDGTLSATKLIDGLLAEIAGDKDAFQKAVGALLVDIDDDHHRGLQSAVNRMRNELSGDADVSIERAFYDGFSLAALSSTAAQVRHRLELDESYLRLLDVGEQSASAFAPASLRDSLVRGLPAAGVRTALLSCLPDRNSSDLVAILCLVDGAVHETPQAPFPASQLIPPDVLRLDRINTLLVFPLVHEHGLLGFIAFDHSDGNNAYMAFRTQIASVLKNIRLHQELLHKRLEALSVLSGGVAHDLNNALGPLLVIPDVILEQLARLQIDEDIYADMRSDLQSMKTACVRAAQTIKDLLTLGRQGRTPKTDLELNRLVKSCMADGAWSGGQMSQVRMRVDLAPEPLPIRAAESQLARAITNLVRNALEATDGKGEVTVGTARVQIAGPLHGFETIPAGIYAALSIADDGCGIAAEELGRVFEPFFTKKRAGENSGTGLGLAIVHGVVKEHGGFVDVTSKLRVGTTFTVYLPLVPVPQVQQHRHDDVPRGSGRILIVDDEFVQLRTCRRALTRLGYTVETSASGNLACEMFRTAAPSRQSPFDLVMVDMLLGETRDGLQVIQEIRALFPSQKVIIVSGHAPTEYAQSAVKRGLPWLAKPYDMDTLAKAVADTLRDKAKTSY